MTKTVKGVLAKSVLVCLAVMLSACMSAEDRKTLEARASSRADLIQVPGLIREPIPVNFILPDGSSIMLDGIVTRPDRPGRFPLAVISHGTSTELSERKDEVPNQNFGAAIYFAQRGWAAVTVVRPGYGRSGGPFLEEVGPCDARDFHGLVTRMGEEVLTILKSVSGEPWADPSRVLLAGQSGGGLASLTAAATNPPGVVGVVNFAGGAGASSSGTTFCQPERLVAEMAELGKRSRIPSLWIYTQNDSFFRPALVSRMFAAYQQGGAPATFFDAPAYGDEGHYFMEAVSKWRPQVDAFMQSVHLSAKVEIDLPGSSVPPPSSVDAAGDAFFNKYLAMQYYEKAYAVGYNGNSGYATGYPTIGAAKLIALQQCQVRGPGCHVYAIGNQLAPH